MRASQPSLTWHAAQPCESDRARPGPGAGQRLAQLQSPELGPGAGGAAVSRRWGLMLRPAPQALRSPSRPVRRTGRSEQSGVRRCSVREYATTEDIRAARFQRMQAMPPAFIVGIRVLQQT